MPPRLLSPAVRACAHAWVTLVAPLVVPLVACVVVPSVVEAQQSPPAARAAAGDVFILIGAGDTVAVERFTRRANALESEMIVRQAGGRIRISADFSPTGGATRFRMAYRQATADTTSAPLQAMDARFTGDSVIVDLTGGGRTATQRFATRPKALPFLNPSFALLELIVRQARAAGGDSVAVPVWNAQGGTTMTANVIRRGADSVVVMLGAALHFAVSPDGELLGGSIPAQKARIVRVRGAGSSAMAVAKPDYSAPPGAPYTAEDVRVRSPKGHVLAGTLTLPKGRTGRVPAVVTITGSGPQDRDESIPLVKGYRIFRQVADTLGRHGIAVLRLDDRGWGESTGDHGKATSADFAEDVRAALAWLRTRPEIDSARLGLVGHSEGGLIAPIVAVREPSLRGIALLAGPAKPGRTILDFQLRNGITTAAALSATQKDSALRLVPQQLDSIAAASPWMKFFFDHDPIATARRVKVPALILQGATDQQVTAEQAAALERAFRAGGNTRVTTRVFPRANHFFVEDADGTPARYASLTSGVVRPDVLGALLDWLVKTLR